MTMVSLLERQHPAAVPFKHARRLAHDLMHPLMTQSHLLAIRRSGNPQA
jgi:hypothetical protein